jgi:hypothetical protein
MQATVTPVLATCDIHSKNRDKCQEHHEGTTRSYWLQESSTEKRELLSSSDPPASLLLQRGKRSYEKAFATEREAFFQGTTQAPYVSSSSEKHGERDSGSATSQMRHTPPHGTFRFFVHLSEVTLFCGNRDAIHPGLARRGSGHSGDLEEQAPHLVLGSVA